MKRIISLILAFSVVLTGINFTVFASGEIDKEYLPKIYIDSPLPSAQVLHAVFSEVDGKDYMFTTASGSPAVLNVYNLDDNVLVATHKLPGTKNIWYHLINTDGNLYIASKGCFFRYNPYTDELKEYGFIASAGLSDTFTFDNDEKGNIYIGCCGNGEILKYNIETDDFTNFGQVCPRTVYVRSVSYLNGYVYAGIKGNDFVKLYKINANDPSDKEEIPLPENPDYYDLSKIQWIYDSCVAGDKVIFYVKEVAVSPMLVYDTISQSWCDIGFTGSFKGLYSSPVKDGKTYFTSKGWMYALDIETCKVENLNFQVESTDTTHAIGWVTMENNPEHTGDILTVVNTNTGQPIYYDLEKKERFTLPQIELRGGAFTLQSIAAGDYKNGDDAIYIGSYLGETSARYNLNSKKFEYYYINQTEGMLANNGKMYFGTYTKANVHEYDYTKPMNERLKRVGQIKPNQDRPFALTAADDGKIWLGTIPDYGYLGGALAQYNPDTKEVTAYPNIINNQSIIGLAYKDGLIYGSTSVWGGLSSVPSEPEAKMFIFDTVTGKVIKEFTPKIKGITNPLWIGGLAFDKNGKLWGATGGTLFSINPDTEEVIDVIKFQDYTYSTTTHQWRPLYIRFDEEGYLYVNIDSIQIVNVDTLETRSLSKEIGEKVHLFDLDKNGNIYYASAAQLWMLPFNNINYQRFEDNEKMKGLFSDKTAMFPENSLIYSNGSIKQIDPDNDAVVPFVENGRTLVPVRVLSEEFGADIDWDEEEELVTVNYNDTVIEIKIGESKIKVNGLVKAIDCTAKTVEGRTFIPLRAVSEAFGKQVYWHDSGLIVISDEPIDYDENTIAKINLFSDVYMHPLYKEETAKEDAVDLYNKTVASYNGEQIKFNNWNFEEKSSEGTVKGYVKTNDFTQGCTAGVTNTRAFAGTQSLNVNDISTTASVGYSTTLIPYTYADNYAVIIPLFLSSGRTSIEIAYYDVDGTYLGRDVHNEEPGHNVWNIMNYEVPKLFKGAKYLRIRLYTSEYWLSDSYYDEITVIKY